MTDTTDTTKPAPRRSAFQLMMHAPIYRRPDVDQETFKGLQSVDEVRAWLEKMHAPAEPTADGLPAVLQITLCGSGRFRREFVEWNAKLTALGFIVFSIGNGAAGNPLIEGNPIGKSTVDAVHFAKIQRSDAILVIDGKVDGKPYVGESTAREIAWAEQLGKPVFFAGDLTGYDYTKPNPEPWGAYSAEHLEDKTRWLQGVLSGMYHRSPPAMLAKCSGIYLADVHEEYGWSDKIDENAIAEDPETYPEGARLIAMFQAELGEAVLVIDKNSFDPGIGRQVVRWHLEVLSDEEKAERDAKWKAALDKMRAESKAETAAPAEAGPAAE